MIKTRQVIDCMEAGKTLKGALILVVQHRINSQAVETEQ